MNISAFVAPGASFTATWEAPPRSYVVVPPGGSLMGSGNISPTVTTGPVVYKYSCTLRAGGRNTVSRYSIHEGAGQGYLVNPSGYITITAGYLPTVTGSTNLGEKKAPFSYSYTTTTDSRVPGAISVTEKLDSKVIRSHSVSRGSSVTMTLSNDDFLQLLPGSHTLSIIVSTGAVETAALNASFVKKTTRCGFTLTNANIIRTATQAKRMTISVAREVPPGGVFTVEACNNGFDAVPLWEDATYAVTAGLAHVFKNKEKNASDWGVNIRVSAERNGALGDCWIANAQGVIE